MSKVTISEKGASQYLINTEILTSTFFSILYLIVNLIPLMGAIDEMGPQWFYLGVVNIVIAILLFFKNKSYQEAIKNILGSTFGILFVLLVVYMGCSYFYSINPTEMLVCFARFMTTAIAFINLAVLIKKDSRAIKLILIVLTISLLADSYYTVAKFLNKPIEVTNYDAFILSIKGNASNKNIWAASIAIKIPFCMYLVYEMRSKWKYFFMAILTLAIMSIIIMSTRSTYVSVSLNIFFFLVLASIEIFRKNINIGRVLKVIIPIIVGVVFAFLCINAVSKQFDKGARGGYANLGSRISSINMEGSGRRDFWYAGIDYIQKHKLIGAGFGNWKIAVIPYESVLLNDNILSYHVHNDFIETTAEIGIIGGLLYISLFVWTFIMFCKHYFSKNKSENRILQYFSLMALVGYGIDASLNFPMERPVTQILFAFICAINLTVYLDSKKNKETNTNSTETKSFLFSEITTISIVLIMLPFLYITNSTFESMKVQPRIYGDLEAKKLSIGEVETLNTFFPNLSATGLSMSDIIGTYYVKNGQYKESIPYFDQGKLDNPYFHLSDTYKSLAYINLNQDDSALKYAKIGFNERPRSQTAYNQIININAKLKDTVALKKAFLTYIKYRNEESGWYLYLNNIIRIKQSFTPEIIKLLDSASILFPANADIKNLQNIYKNGAAVVQQQNNLVSSPNTIQNERNITLSKIINNATLLFSTQKYMESAKAFLEAAALDPNNYVYYENAGVCYYNNNNLDQAIVYFDKSINLKTSVSGKSEFFKGIALNALGKKEASCKLLQISKDKGYPDAEKYLKLYCN